jgi:hypothetical protein
VSVFLVAPEIILPAPLFIITSFLSHIVHFRRKFVSSLSNLAAPLFSLVAPRLFSLVAPKKKMPSGKSSRAPCVSRAARIFSREASA